MSITLLDLLATPVNAVHPVAGSASPSWHERSFPRQMKGNVRPFSCRTSRRKQRLVQLVKAVAEAVELTASDAWVEKTLQTLDRRKAPATYDPIIMAPYFLSRKSCPAMKRIPNMKAIRTLSLTPFQVNCPLLCILKYTAGTHCEPEILLIISHFHRLAGLRQECQTLLETQRMPTLRNEEYRFTDVSKLLRTDAQVFFFRNSPTSSMKGCVCLFCLCSLQY